jgi:PAS domain S-box-containing protein
MNEQETVNFLIDSIPALVAYIDCNMQLQYSNQPFKTFFSIHGGVSGKSFPLVAGRHFFMQLQKHMGKVLIGERAHFQISVDTPGGLQYLDATLSPDFDGRERVRGFIFHSSDITEKNRTKQALTDYFDNVAIGLHWVNADGTIIWANRAELNMLGYSENEYIGHHISEFHASKDSIKGILRRLAQKETLQNCEADLVCKDGSIRHVAINSSVLWENEKFIHTRCFTIDVTEQKRAAQAVRESEARFKTMADLVPLVIWTTDEHGNCNFLSVRWKELTGKSSEEGLGNLWVNFIHPDEKVNIVNSWNSSFRARKPFEARFRLLNASGGYTVSYANSSPRHDANGQLTGYFGILQDISTQEQIKSSLEKIVLDRTEDLRKRNAELKQAENALKQKNIELEKINNDLSSFAHVASHDLQEPLLKIQAFSERLFELEGNKFSDKGKNLYKQINDSSDRMRTLIQDLLSYSQSNDKEGKFETLDLNVLVREIVAELEVRISDKKAKIENLGLPTLNVIQFQFHQLFLNLLSNALKFSRENADPVVVIKSELLQGDAVPDFLDHLVRSWYHIIISDNGIGFESQFSEKIFDMFHRLHSRSEYEGTGIGLAICKKIVENHGGKIIAEGRINTGAAFHIYLPAENYE